MVIVIYHYVERVGELLLPPIFPYNIYDHESILSRWTSQYTYTIINKYDPGEQLGDYQKKYKDELTLFCGNG